MSEHNSPQMATSESGAAIQRTPSPHTTSSFKQSSVAEWTDSTASSEPATAEESKRSSISEIASSQEPILNEWDASAGDRPRPNPKLLANRMDRAVPNLSSTALEQLRIDYNYRLYSLVVGYLFGLCNLVPYLLGPRHYLNAIVRFSRYPISIQAFHDENGKLAMDPLSMTILDRVFVTILWLLKQPAGMRPANWDDLCLEFNVHEDRLVVYKDIGYGREPKPCHLHYDDFVEMAAAWKKLPNPALVAEDPSVVVTPWHIVADKVCKMDIPSEVIDKALYTELVSLTEPQVQVRLMKLIMTDELRQRQDVCTRREMSNTFTYTVPKESHSGAIKRFSHQHPEGYLVDTTPALDDRPFVDVDMSYDAEKSQEDNGEKKEDGQAVETRTKRRFRRACQWGAAITLLILVGVTIALLWHFGKAGHD